MPPGKQWAVYAALLVKRGSKPKLCIGSGTSAVSGYRSRTRHYYNKKDPLLPRFVRLAYDNGYSLAHIGALCWMPLPSAANVPRARLRFLAVEAVFTCTFYTMYPTARDALWTDFMPWSREDVAWEPANSHIPLSEGSAAGLDLTDDQLETLAAEAKRNAKLNTKKSYHRRRDLDPKAWNARRRAREGTAKGRARDGRAYTRRKTSALAKGKNHCDVCNLNFIKPAHLREHYDSVKHRRAVAAADAAADS